MTAAGLLRFGPVQKMKGPLHHRLQMQLREAWLAKAVTQESLALAIGYSQENTGQYLRGGKAGALDLDQANAALHHIGSSLPDFLAGQPPVELSRAEKVARRLEGRDDVIELVEALLAVPRQRLPVVRGLIESGYFAATGRRLAPPSGSGSGNAPAARTTKARARRPRARGRKKPTDDE